METQLPFTKFASTLEETEVSVTADAFLENAASTWATMNPEFKPASSTRKGGS